MVNKYDWERHEIGDCPFEFEAMCLYQCAACKNERTFLLHLEVPLDDETAQPEELVITKVGQYPPWSIDISRDLSRVLGEYKDVFKK
jgi:hypothetical protein